VNWKVSTGAGGCPADRCVAPAQGNVAVLPAQAEASQDVVPRAAVEIIAAAAVQNGVVSAIAVEDVAAASSDKEVVTLGAGRAFYGNQGVAADGSGRRHAYAQIHGDATGAVAKHGEVEALAAV
jgi:hypothetical protein